jgi:hypothetical protein
VSEMSTKTPPAIDIERQSTGVTASPSVSKPVLIWATFGGALLLLQVWVWARWITGPYFTRVPVGVSDPPSYMKVPLIANAAILWLALPAALWWFFIRPWRRERRISLDGLLVLSTGLMFFQDPLLNYLNTWCTYNTWLFNRGSWSAMIPGAVSPEAPGRQVAEPLLTNVPGYAYGVVLITIVGCAVMRKIKARWPNISAVRLVIATYGFTFLLDFLMEGCLLLPIGFYSYPGAIRAVSVNAGHYYQWPIYEGLMWGGVQAALCCLRYFTDEKGQTVVERGLDRVGGGVARQQFVRFLALFAGASACFFFLYNVPAQWFGMHADPWPTDVQKRSYLNGGICGDGSDQPCPNPALPIPTKRSGFIDNDGRLVLPPGAQLPSVVPFQHGR